MLIALLLVPALAGLTALLVPRDRPGAANAVATAGAGVSFVLAAVALLALRIGGEGDAYHFALRTVLPFSCSAEFYCGLDGIRAILLFMTAFLTMGAVLLHRGGGPRARLLLLQAALTGVLVSLDLLLLTGFWTLALLAAGLLLARREPRDAQVAARRLTGTLAGAALMLVAVLMIRARAGTLDLTVLGAGETFRGAVGQGRVVFALLGLGFALPLVTIPFHGAALRSQEAATAPVGALLVGALTKIGAFGVLLVALPVAPAAAAHFSVVPAVLGGLDLLLAGVLAVRTTSPRRLAVLANLAFSGLVLLAAGALGAGAGPGIARGVLVLLVVHGLFAGLLVLVTALASDLDGPRHRTLMRIALVGLAVLPVLALLVSGGDGVVVNHPLPAAGALLGLALLAAGLLRTAVRLSREDGGPDLDLREMLVLGALAVTAMVVGLVPPPVASLVSDAAERIAAALVGGGTP